ncbi:beta-propeller domain-containing protein [Roseateles sp. P5_E7]
MRTTLAILLAAMALSAPAYAQPAEPALSPELLPGKGLSEHPFLYCGEYEHNADQQTVHLIRVGKEVWSYAVKFRVVRDEKPDIQELGDCTLLPNGHVLFTTRFGAMEVTPDKTVAWQYIAPSGTEVHSLQALDGDRVLLTQNGNPAKLLLIDRKRNVVERSLIVPVGKPENVHGQLRRARMTTAGTFLVAHMDMNQVVEYDDAMKPLWALGVESPWQAVRLKNGNTLVSSNKGFVREVDGMGRVVWSFTRADAAQAGYDLRNVQEVSRLANGNTVLANWVAGSLKPAQWPGTVQVLEITPDKKIAWALREWVSPNLGPATSIQLLDQPAGELQR